MSISFDKIALQAASGVHRQASAPHKVGRGNKLSSGKTRKSFDEIRISTQGGSAVEEKDFVKMMEARLSVKVRQTAEPERLESLRSQVAAGTYGIDASAIAGQILLEGRGELQDAGAF